MIPFDNGLCETLEAVMAKEPERKYVEILSDSAVQLMTQTNRIFQRNIDIWPDEKLKMYGLRVSKYGNVIQAFTSIMEENPTHEILDMAISDCTRLYTEINIEHSNEWNSANAARRGVILQEILLPHMLMIRFLKKYNSEKFD